MTFRILGGRARPAVPLRIMDGSTAPQTASGEDEDAHETVEGPNDPTIMRDVD
jgi:hypothetical protein